MSDAKTVAALQRNLADAEVERLRLVEEVAMLHTERASLRMALSCARQNASFAFASLKVPSMDGGNLEKARGWLLTIKADIRAELARGTS